MSERIRVGGIRNNPAIDKINTLNSIDAKGYAVQRMEELMLKGGIGDIAGEENGDGSGQPDYQKIPLHFPTGKLQEN